MYYFINSGYVRIAEMQKCRNAEMQKMEAVWQKKAPLAELSTCDEKPCVQVTGGEYTNKNGDRLYMIKQGK